MPNQTRLAISQQEMLTDCERHLCTVLQDHWTMITLKDGQAVLWDNSTGDPQGPLVKLESLVVGITYCPFCGLKLVVDNPVPNSALLSDSEEYDGEVTTSPLSPDSEEFDS